MGSFHLQILTFKLFSHSGSAIKVIVSSSVTVFLTLVWKKGKTMENSMLKFLMGQVGKLSIQLLLTFYDAEPILCHNYKFYLAA